MIQGFGGRIPRIDPGAWVHSSAVVIGDVTIGAGVSVWPTVVLRGDMGPITIGDDTNLQDGTIAHDTTDWSVTTVGRRVTVGHRVILHGCAIGDDCLIGMGSIVMDRVQVGAGSFVAAGSLLTPGKQIPPGSFVMGSPAKVVRAVEEEDRAQIQTAWKTYSDRMRVWLAGS